VKQHRVKAVDQVAIMLY